MPYLPQLQETKQTEKLTDTFGGYNHNLKINDGEFYDTKNLTSDLYPLLANRKERKVLTEEDLGYDASKMYGYINIGGKGISLVDDGVVTDGSVRFLGIYIGNERQPIPTDWGDTVMPGIGLNVAEGEREMVTMGAYVIIYPDKVYFNTADITDYGRMGAEYVTGFSEVMPCDEGGADITYKATGKTAPASPSNGDYWLDTSSGVSVLKRWNKSANMWTTVPTTYAKLVGNVHSGLYDFSKHFKKGDGIQIDVEGTSEGTTIYEELINAISGSKIITDVGINYITIKALVPTAITMENQVLIYASAKRVIPELDFVTECNNRLWGCRYGYVDGKLINEIYCSALGDFKNWEKYEGVATDSYRASCGTDGPWTGAITYNGNPLFFKEKYLHKVFVSGSGAHQITSKVINGVQLGSHKSLCIIGDTLFYKSQFGVCSFTGTTPLEISSNLGDIMYYDAVAGAFDNKYHISMRDDNNEWTTFVFNTKNGLWIKEDNTRVKYFCASAQNLYICVGGDNGYFAIDDGVGVSEATGNVEWMAETGLMGYAVSDKYGNKYDIGEKYVSRFNIRMILPRGSECDLFMDYDSEGVWNHCGHIDGSTTKTFTLPVRPRRCDHFRFRIEGKGDVRIYSIARLYESGSDEQWN